MAKFYASFCQCLFRWAAWALVVLILGGAGFLRGELWAADDVAFPTPAAETKEGPQDFFTYLHHLLQTSRTQDEIVKGGPGSVGGLDLTILAKLAESLPADDPLLLYWAYEHFVWATEEERGDLIKLYAEHPAFASLYALYPRFLTARKNKLPTLPRKPHHLKLWQQAIMRVAAMAALSSLAQNNQRPFLSLFAFRQNFGPYAADLIMHWWFSGFQEIFALARGMSDDAEKPGLVQKSLPLDDSPAYQLYHKWLDDERSFTLAVGNLLHFLGESEGLKWDAHLPEYLSPHRYYGSFTLHFTPQATITPFYLNPVRDPLLQAILDFSINIAIGLAEGEYAASLPQIKIVFAAWPEVQNQARHFTKAPLVRLQTTYRQGLMIVLNLPLLAYFQQQATLRKELNKAQNAALHRITKNCQIWLQGPRWN